MYNDVDLGLITIKSVDLPLRVRRKPSKKRNKKNKIKLGNSIETRPLEVEKRKEFGHWEIDTIIPKETKNEPVLLTLTERKTRAGTTILMAWSTMSWLMAGCMFCSGVWKMMSGLFTETLTISYLTVAYVGRVLAL